MNYKLEDYYYHTISKDDVNQTYQILEKVLYDRQLKSQELLGKSENKFNGLNYISLASYTKNSEYKSFIIDEENFKNSKLSNMFDNYNSYLEYMKLDSLLEKPLSKEEFFIKNNTTNKRDYFNYLDSISISYPVDIKYLYNKTSDIVYKFILDIINDDILNCAKSENCFDEYIKKSKGITFVFPKTIEVENVTIIPNLPFEIESKLVELLSNQENRYSNQIGEVQVKSYLDIDKAIGIIVSNDINLDIINKILIENKFNDLKLFKLINNELIEI